MLKNINELFYDDGGVRVVESKARLKGIYVIIVLDTLPL
jgi:hypothetical protein